MHFMIASFILCLSLAHCSGVATFVRRQPQDDWAFPTCPDGFSVCDIYSGTYCFNSTNGAVCCEDGSGLCPSGFDCGTGIAANLCCQPGRTPEQCAMGTAVSAGSVGPSPTSSSQSVNSGYSIEIPVCLGPGLGLIAIAVLG